MSSAAGVTGWPGTGTQDPSVGFLQLLTLTLFPDKVAEGQHFDKVPVDLFGESSLGTLTSSPLSTQASGFLLFLSSMNALMLTDALMH